MEVTPIEILAVEDREDDIIQLMKAFRDARVRNRVHVAETGAAALDFVFQRGQHAGAPRVDLMVLDLGLPDMEGLDVLRQIRADPRFSDLAVIVLTISDQDEDIIRSYDLGVQAFMQKPVRTHNVQDFFINDGAYAFVITKD
jgi:two-component system response regulator